MTNEEQQKHEAAIEAWHGKVADALAAVDIGYMRDPGTPGSRAFEELFRLADDAVKLARRAPRPEPEPRASSALLEAVKRVLPDTTGFSSGQTKISYHDFCIIRKAIEAEEARGPSEVAKVGEIEQLRKESDEANIRAFDAENRLAEAFDVLCRLACLGYGDRPGNSDGNRIAIDALGHLFDCVWYQPEGGDGCWANKADGPIEAALSTPPQPNHASDDDELIRYADRSSRGQIDGFDWVAADALSELVRRALARGPK